MKDSLAGEISQSRLPSTSFLNLFIANDPNDLTPQH